MLWAKGYKWNIVIIYCPEEGCIGKYAPLRIDRFAEARILHPEARGLRCAKSLLRQISRSEGHIFPIHLDSSQCIDILFFHRGRFRKLYPKWLPLWKKDGKD